MRVFQYCICQHLICIRIHLLFFSACIHPGPGPFSSTATLPPPPPASTDQHILFRLKEAGLKKIEVTALYFAALPRPRICCLGLALPRKFLPLPRLGLASTFLPRPRPRPRLFCLVYITGSGAGNQGEYGTACENWRKSQSCCDIRRTGPQLKTDEALP